MRATEQETMFLRPSEAAALTGLSTRAIYRAIERGELRSSRLCSRLRIPRDSFDEWVERGVVAAGEHLAPAPPPAALPLVAGRFPRPARAQHGTAAVSVERVVRRDGSVVWRVRWRQGPRNRSKVLGLKRDSRPPAAPRGRARR